MRISDWSSDVCSSDLPAFYDDDSVSWKDTKLGFTVARVPVHQRHAAGLPVDCFDGDLRLDDYRWRIAASLGPRRVWIGPVVKVVGPEKAEGGAKLDRKSGVSGKSVSGRVELGGGGIIRKKKKT